MKAAVHMITLAVQQLETMAAWYEHVFGWHIHHRAKDTIVFKTDNFLLSLVDNKKFDHELYQWPEETVNNRFAFSIFFENRQVVDDWFIQLLAKKVTVIRMPFTTPNHSYKGYIADPEGNYWELGYHYYQQNERSSIPEVSISCDL